MYIMIRYLFSLKVIYYIQVYIWLMGQIFSKNNMYTKKKSKLNSFKKYLCNKVYLKTIKQMKDLC